MSTDATGQQMPRTPAQILLRARQKASRDKRAAVVQALTAMLTDGDTITFVKVARRAQVSTWLVYSAGMREQIQTAITQQQRQHSQTPHQAPGIDSLRTNLALARQEIRELRPERDELRARLSETLGRQLTSLSTTPLVERLNRVTGELTDTRAANAELTAHVQTLEDDLAAARTSLRRMIRDQNTDPS